MLHKVLKSISGQRWMYEWFTPKGHSGYIPDIHEARDILLRKSPKPSSCMRPVRFNHSEQMMLSVIVPAYNSEKYIKDCILSIVKQDVDFSYEVIVVNDGSTDSTRSVVRSISLEEPKVRLIDQNNQGFSGARNTGINEARGHLLAFVDSDDVLAQGHLAALVSDYIKGGVDYVNGLYTVMSKDGRLLQKGELHRLHGAPWGRVYSRRIWDNLRFPEGYWFEDTVHAFCIEPKWRGREVADWGYCYRRNPLSISNTAKNANKSIDSYWIAEELLDWCHKLGVPFNQTLLNALIRQLGTVTLLRNLSLSSVERRCLFSLASHLLSSQRAFSDMRNTLGSHYADTERSLRTRDYKLWLYSCLWNQN